MRGILWMKTTALVLVTLWLLPGVAWADPSGAADLPQILNVATAKTSALNQQTRTFLTTDPILAGATYYDPNPICDGVAPVLLQVLFFNLEGQLILTRQDATSTPIAQGQKYQALSLNMAPGALVAGAYNLIFLVRDCTNVNIFVSGFYPIRVLNP